MSQNSDSLRQTSPVAALENENLSKYMKFVDISEADSVEFFENEIASLLKLQTEMAELKNTGTEQAEAMEASLNHVMSKKVTYFYNPIMESHFEGIKRRSEAQLKINAEKN